MDIETFKALDEPAKFAATMFAYVPYPLNSTSLGGLFKRRFGEMSESSMPAKVAASAIKTLAAVENQAADRAHRIGQRNPVTVYRLIAADTVEERVLELHKEKKQIAEDMLEGTGSAALSPAQLMGLFKSGNPDSSNSVSHGK